MGKEKGWPLKGGMRDPCSGIDVLYPNSSHGNPCTEFCTAVLQGIISYNWGGAGGGSRGFLCNISFKSSQVSNCIMKENSTLKSYQLVYPSSFCS